jgi:hypothetical protein
VKRFGQFFFSTFLICPNLSGRKTNPNCPQIFKHPGKKFSENFQRAHFLGNTKISYTFPQAAQTAFIILGFRSL